MVEQTKPELGTIRIHKKVLADIAHSAIDGIDGVHLIANDWQGAVMELMGKKSYPGIIVTEDRENHVSIEVKLVVRYGLNIPETARRIQDAIKKAVAKSVDDITLKDVNVNIQGMERTEE